VPGGTGEVVDVAGLPSSFMIGEPVWDAEGLTAMAFGYDASVSTVPTAQNGLQLVTIAYSASGGAVGTLKGDAGGGATLIGCASEADAAPGSGVGVGLTGDGTVELAALSKSADGTLLVTDVGPMDDVGAASGCTMYAAGGKVGSAAYGMYSTDCLNGDSNEVGLVVVDASTAEPMRSMVLYLKPSTWSLGPGQPAVLQSALDVAVAAYSPAPTPAPGVEMTTEEVEVEVVQHSLAFDFDGDPSDFSGEAVASLETAIAAALGYEGDGLVEVVCICSGPCSSSCSMEGNARRARRVLLQGGGLYVDYQIEVSAEAGADPAAMAAMLTGGDYVAAITTSLAESPYFPPEALVNPPVSAATPVTAVVTKTIVVEGTHTEPIIYDEPEELGSASDSLNEKIPAMPSADAFLKYSHASSLIQGHALWGSLAAVAISWAA